MIAGRSSAFSWRSSSFNRWSPGAVIGNFCTSLNPSVVEANEMPCYGRAQAPPPGLRRAATIASERTAKIGLERRDFKRSRLQGCDGVYCGTGACHSRVVRNPVSQGTTADREAVGNRLRSRGSVDDQLHVARADGIDAMGPAF